MKNLLCVQTGQEVEEKLNISFIFWWKPIEDLVDLL